MKDTFLRYALPLTVGTAAFFATVNGVEMLAWWWLAPVDPLLDPAMNAARFAGAFAIGLGSGFAMLPASARRLTQD